MLDDEDVTGADSTGYIDLLVSLKEAIVQSPIGVNLAFQDIILNALFLEVEDLLSQSVSMRAFISLSSESEDSDAALSELRIVPTSAGSACRPL